jgi:hypothetical protein
MTDEEGYCQRRLERIQLCSCGDGRPREPALSEVEGSKPSKARQLPVATATLGFAPVAGFSRTVEGGCPYVLLGADCSPSIAAFTFAETASVSCTVNPAVEIGSPTRISSGWHLMW